MSGSGIFDFDIKDRVSTEVGKQLSRKQNQLRSSVVENLRNEDMAVGSNMTMIQSSSEAANLYTKYVRRQRTVLYSRNKMKKLQSQKEQEILELRTFGFSPFIKRI